MAKKSNVNIRAITVIRGIVFLFIGFMVFVSYTKTVEFLTSSPLFAVQDVVIDASIQFIDTTELRRLKGRNIFKVNLLKQQTRLQSQYPQIDQLRVIRELPDRIKVLARKREPLFQIPAKGKILLVDAQGNGMYYIAGALDLPVVKSPLANKYLRIGREMINAFRSHPHLAPLKIVTIDLTNLSRIEVVFNPAFRVIVDEDSYKPKVDMLEMLVAQKRIDFAVIKYVDLRFNEPVLGENSEETPDVNKIKKPQ